jgi:hypothetical protein
MSKLLFTLPWGRVHQTHLQENVFVGNPDKYADALLEQYHGNAADVLLFIDRQFKGVAMDGFFKQVHNITNNRLAGNKRRDRAARLAKAAG